MRAHHIYREVRGATPVPKRRKGEALLVVLAGLTTFALSSHAELYERMNASLPRYEVFQADELLFVLLSVLAALVMFSILRWREAREELVSRLAAEQALLRLAAKNRALARTLLGLQEAERRSIARELHDHLGQSCNAVRIDAVFLSRALVADSAEGAAASRIASTADELYQTVRGLLYELRPPALDSVGLIAALQTLCESWEERSAINCALLPSGDLGALGEQTNIALYRIVQESLSNVVKHANASHVRIHVARLENPPTIELVIEDDGIGQQINSVRSGLGWLGMKERASMLGGELSIGLSRLGGIQIRCRVPVADAGPNEGENQ